ncbi:MAG: response regulator [Cyanobacteria bacterium J06621_3]
MAENGFPTHGDYPYVESSEAASAETKTASSIRVLLIEDSTADARLMQEFLWGTPLYKFQLTHVDRLGEALQRLQTSNYDIVLLDLTLPDSAGLTSLARLLDQDSSLPVVVLTNTNNPELAVEAVRQGAQDYLVKRHMNNDVLVRSLRYAIERKQQAEALHQANEALESRVRTRTHELEVANQSLIEEVAHRQAVQERLTLAQKIGKIGIFEWDIQGDKMTWSHELEVLYKMPEHSFAGNSDAWISLIHPEDSNRVRQELWQAVSLGRGLNTEFRLCLGNATAASAASACVTTPTLLSSNVSWIAVKSSLLTDKQGNPLQMLGIHIDITEKKQLEAQFLQAQRLESLGALASGIAHDLNNILTPILGVAQLLPMVLPNIDERTQQLIEMLNGSARRGTKLVQQIVSFARSSGNFRHILSIAELLEEIERIIKQTLPCSIKLEMKIASNLWLIEGDDTPLHQVFMNLCVNARDAMPKGGSLRIHAENLLIDETYLRMYPQASLGPHVMVTVADEGTGIALNVLKRIFDPFFTTKSANRGTGLGLAAVQDIVKSHGGFIKVTTALDQGSQFQVFLPADPSSSNSIASPIGLLHGQQELILVVDDEPEICQIMKLSLESCGYRTLVANNGIDAIALLAEHRDNIDCAVVDLMMPEMDGWTAIPLLQRLQPQLPVITITGDIVNELNLEQLCVQGKLLKPFSTQEILMLLQAVLSKVG